MTEPLAWEPTPEDVAFYDVYGDWDPLTPGGLRDLMAGFPAAWWIVGGHAIEAFTGVRRFHEDIDLVVFDKDVPALRKHLGDTSPLRALLRRLCLAPSQWLEPELLPAPATRAPRCKQAVSRARSHSSVAGRAHLSHRRPTRRPPAPRA